jgi:hypothetical protein
LIWVWILPVNPDKYDKSVGEIVVELATILPFKFNFSRLVILIHPSHKSFL